MKQPAWSPTPSPKPRLTLDSAGSSVRLGPKQQLSAVEKQIFDVLSGRGQAMTIHQLQSLVDLAVEELDAALASLVKRRLISRLNTLVPSYFANYPGVRMYGE